MTHPLYAIAKAIILFILCALPLLGVAQIAEVPCICETTGLELKPLLEKPKIVLINNPDEKRTYWMYERDAVLVTDTDKLIEKGTPVPIVETTPVVTPRSQFPRKRKNKSKIRLKKRKLKKYSGQCPAF